jgi:peptide-methionine (R)-S-oxide reductase
MILLLSSLMLALCLSCQPRREQLASTASTLQPESTNPYYSRTDTTVIALPDSVWKTVLPDSIFQVGRKNATEKAFTGKYWNYTGLGTYYCAVCGNKLFRSDSKFSSNCGWPSFFEPSRPTSVAYLTDTSHGLNRIEVRCGRCNSHLGHLFDDGPPPTGKRYCMNSIILDFVPELKTGTEL